MLAQVYLELIGGKQRKIEFENNIKSLNNKIGENVNVEQKHYPKLTIRLSKQDENNHQEMLKKVPGPKRTGKKLVFEQEKKGNGLLDESQLKE